MDSCNVTTNRLNLLFNFGLMLDLECLIVFQIEISTFAFFATTLVHDDAKIDLMTVLIDVGIFAFSDLAFANFDICDICGTAGVTLGGFC